MSTAARSSHATSGTHQHAILPDSGFGCFWGGVSCPVCQQFVCTNLYLFESYCGTEPESREKNSHIWAATWQNQQSDWAPSEDSDQPGHPPSLIRVLAVRMKKAWVFSYPLSTQRSLWSDRVDAQADMSLCWARSHFVGFVMLRLIYRILEIIESEGERKRAKKILLNQKEKLIIIRGEKGVWVGQSLVSFHLLFEVFNLLIQF